jgi:PAS domain S-box-containing protein
MEQFEAFSTSGQPLPPEQWPTMRALRGEFVQNFEILYRRKSNGETGAREISTAPVPDATGENSQVIITYRDTSERRKADEARNRLAAIVESSEDAIIGKTTEGIVTSWNRAAEKLFGYSATEMMGRSIKLLLPADRQQEEDDILRRIQLGETVDHFETVRTCKDGTVVNVSLTISPIRDGNGEIVGASKIARNISDRVHLERQLHQSQKMEAIGQLTGGIAHDFNNMLSVMIGNLDLLETMLAENEVALKRVRTAQKSAMRGADLTRRLLAFSRKEELSPSPVVLEDAVHGLVELAARALGPEIKVTTHCDPSLPRVNVDPSRLESALLNLVVNARDAMPKGGTLILSADLVTVEASHPAVLTGELNAGSYGCVAVSDTGHGMTRETLEHVFEPFFTTKPRGRGTGLGLSMVYGFARQSGGAARIYSEQGYGTTVSLYLPLADSSIRTEANGPLALLPLRRGAKILVVDDEEDLLEIATAYLRDMGYKAIQAKDGAAALEILTQEADIDVLITDIIMPGGLNGAELGKQVRLMRPGIKIIYCSGFPADALEESKRNLADGPLLHKPYRREDLAAMLNRVMGEISCAPGDEGAG